MIKKYLILVLIVVFIFSCKENKEQVEEHIKTYKFDIDNCTSNRISDSFKITNIVQLETTEKSLIQRISHIHSNESEILVFDYNQKLLLRYKHTGEFVNKIGTLGNGPNEFLKIRDFYASAKHDTICIYDEKKKQIMMFNKHNDLMKTVKIDSDFYSFELWRNEQLVFFNRMMTNVPKGEKVSNFCVFNMNGGLKYEDIYYNRNEIIQTQFRRHCDLVNLNNEDIALQRYFCDTIFIYNGYKLKPRLYLDFGNHNITQQYKQQLIKDANGNLSVFSNTIRKSKYLINLASRWLENDEYFFTTRRDGKPAVYYFLANKISSETSVFDFSQQDFVWRLFQAPISIYQSNNSSYLIFAVNPISLAKLNSKFKDDFEDFKVKFPEQGAIIDKAISNISIEGNPCLVYAKIKGGVDEK